MPGLKFTESGKRWLEQFNAHEQPFAELLLDSLSLVSANRFSTDLRKLVEKQAAGGGKPTGLVPVRELASGQSYYKPLNERNAQIKLINPTSEIGSEGVCANIAKNAKAGSPRVFTSTPNLKNLREACCRQIFFVEDFIGSGKRCTDFLDGFYRHPTIKSWKSRHLINLKFVVFAATDQGQQFVESHRLKPSVDFVMRCPTLETSALTERQKENISEICRARAPIKEFALGFRESCGLMAFHHKAPNNLPGILWQQSKRWKPLFPNGSVPTDLHACFDEDRTSLTIRERIWELGQPRLALSDWLDRKDNNAIKMAVVLSAICARNRSAEAIANATFLSVLEVEDFLQLGVQWGLLSGEHRLTDDGKRHMERLKIYVSPAADEPKVAQPYFPRSLR